MDLKVHLKTIFYVLFSYKGRISHYTYRRYFIYEFYFIMFTGILMRLLNSDAYNNSDYDPTLADILICIPATVWMFYCNIPVAVKRLHDLNRPGWNLIWGWGCIPFIGSSIVAMVLYHKEGTDAPNRFGDPPPENRLKWWLYLIGIPPLLLYFLLVAASIVVFIGIVISLFAPRFFSPYFG